MGLLGIACGMLATLAAVVRCAADIEDTPSWTLSLNDRLALSTYKFFKAKRSDNIEYTAIDNNTKILSRDAMMVKEFEANCNNLTRRDRYSTSTNNGIAAICKNNQLWEIDIDPVTGRLKTQVKLAEIPAQECFQMDYMALLDIYGLFCINRKERAAGNFYFHTISRATKQVIGSVNFDRGQTDSANFSEVVKVRAATFNKGGMKSENVFIIYDEPKPDRNESLLAKENNFMFVVDVDPVSKQPQPMQMLKFLPDPTFASKSFTKALNYEVIGKKIYAAIFDRDRALRIFACDLNNANYQKLSVACTSLPHNLSLSFGIVRITRDSVVAMYNKFEQKITFCTFAPANAVSVAQNCKVYNQARREADLDIKTFETYNNSVGFVVYIDRRNQNMSLGIDKVSLTADADKMLLDRFKDYSFDDLEINGRYYSLNDAYIDIFDDKRSAEMMLESKLLIPDRAWRFDITLLQEGVTKVKELRGNRIAKFLDKITQTSAFPKMVGFLKSMMRIPLGRTFYSGNGINFNLSTNITSLVSNAGDAMLIIDNIDYRFPHAYFHSYHIQAVMIDSRKLMFIRCSKKMEADFVMSCTKLKINQEYNLNEKAGETITDTFETQTVLVAVSNIGWVYVYNKLNEKMVSYATNLNIVSVTFKQRDNHLALVFIGSNPTNSQRIIMIYQIHLYSMVFEVVSNITKFNPDPSQETGGVFCPRSLRFEIDALPNLVVLNACPTSDRRIIRFDLRDLMNPVQMSNFYIRVPEFKSEKLEMCPDVHTIIVAAPGTSRSLGIGYESFHMQMDLNLNELEVKTITKMVCLGDRAFAIGFLNNSDVFRIAVYFTNRMPEANNRLHSVLSFPDLGTYKDFVGSESDGYAFFTVYSTVKENNRFKAVYLLGPDFYAKSDKRSIVNDARVLTGNGNVNEIFNFMMTFIPQKMISSVSARTKKTPIVVGKAYDVDLNCIWDGPVFDWELGSRQVATITPRIQDMQEYIDPKYNQTTQFVFASHVANIGNHVFTLMQTTNFSVLHVRNLDPAASGNINYAVTLGQRCDSMHVLDLNSEFGTYFNCLYGNEWRFFIYHISKSDGAINVRGYSSEVFKSVQMDVETTDSTKGKIFMLCAIDERNNLRSWTFDANSSMDAQGQFFFIQNFNFSDGSLD